MLIYSESDYAFEKQDGSAGIDKIGYSKDKMQMAVVFESGWIHIYSGIPEHIKNELINALPGKKESMLAYNGLQRRFTKTTHHPLREERIG